MGYQVLIRENGGEPRWIDIEKVFGRTRTVKTYSPSPPTLKEVDGFEEWWKLFDYKKSKSKAKVSWKRHVKNKELVEVIMNHTKQYVASTPDKQYRKHPTTYLNGHSWNDEITKQEVKVDLDQMKLVPPNQFGWDFSEFVFLADALLNHFINDLLID